MSALPSFLPALPSNSFPWPVLVNIFSRWWMDSTLTGRPGFTLQKVMAWECPLFKCCSWLLATWVTWGKLLSLSVPSPACLGAVELKNTITWGHLECKASEGWMAIFGITIPKGVHVALLKALKTNSWPIPVLFLNFQDGGHITSHWEACRVSPSF